MSDKYVVKSVYVFVLMIELVKNTQWKSLKYTIE